MKEVGQNHISFDGGFSCHTGTAFPDRWKFLDQKFSQKKISVLGAGLSYVAAGFGSEVSVIGMKNFDRILAFDSETGEIEVEPGTSLSKLAQVTLPKGWILSVQPGHPSITVGGCLAADVHGKNHAKDGTFKEQVISLRLFHPDKGICFLDRKTQPDIFHLTCGGYGLTGFIVSVKLKLMKAASLVKMQCHLLNSIYDLPEFFASYETPDLLYSWHDFSHWRHEGKGFILEGQYSSSARDVMFSDYRSLTSQKRGRGLKNIYSQTFIRCLNFGYSRRLQAKCGNPFFEDIFSSTFPIAQKSRYFDLFGKEGFIEVQFIIPVVQFREVFGAIFKYLKDHPTPITLASGKQFKEPNKNEPEHLRFSGTGVCFAFNSPRNEQGTRWVRFLNQLTHDLKIKQNLIKNSSLGVAEVKAGYLMYDEFSEKLRAWDSQRRFQSDLSRRLCL